MRNASKRAFGSLFGALWLVGCAQGIQPSEVSPPKDTGQAAIWPRFDVTRSLLATIREEIPTTSDCYQIGDQRVKFKVFYMSSKDKSVWDQTAKNVSRECDGTRVWNDKWYYYSLPDDGSKNLMLMWKNLDTGKYGYAGILNFPTWWGAFTNSNGSPTLIPMNIENGKQLKLSWSSNGHQIDIDILNPENTGPWTANDIWVSFGYPN